MILPGHTPLLGVLRPGLLRIYRPASENYPPGYQDLMLISGGYLEVHRGRNGGYFVLANWGPKSAEHVRRQLVANWAEYQDIFDARILVERMIARTAASRRTRADIEIISAALQAYIDAPDHDASRHADGSLHLAIAKATHNAILVDMSIDFRTRISLNLGAEPYTDEVRQIAIVQHQELVAAVAQGHAEEASDIAARHFALSENLFRELVERAVHDVPPKGET